MTRENTPATSGGSEGSGAGHVGSRLGPLLCWAVVFADIGTSVYYVPGILIRTGRRGGGTLRHADDDRLPTADIEVRRGEHALPRGRRCRHRGEPWNQSLGWRRRRDVHPRRLLPHQRHQLALWLDLLRGRHPSHRSVRAVHHPRRDGAAGHPQLVRHQGERRRQHGHRVDRVCQRHPDPVLHLHPCAARHGARGLSRDVYERASDAGHAAGWLLGRVPGILGPGKHLTALPSDAPAAPEDGARRADHRRADGGNHQSAAHTLLHDAAHRPTLCAPAQISRPTA